MSFWCSQLSQAKHSASKDDRLRKELMAWEEPENHIDDFTFERGFFKNSARTRAKVRLLLVQQTHRPWS